MNLKDLLWNLWKIAESPVVEKEIRESVKEAHWTLSEVRNMLELPADAEPRAIISAVYDLKQKREQK